MLSRAIAIREAASGGEHPDVSTFLSNLANLYYRQQLYAQAEPLYVRALAIREQILDKSHPDVATSLNHLANVYSAQGLHSRAEPLFARALAIREATFGKDHHSVAKILNNLAILYQDQGLYAQAEPLFQRAIAIIAINESTLGESHSAGAKYLNNLAILYVKQGRSAQAEPLFQRALASMEATSGKNHPDVTHPLEDLASLYVNQGHSERAEPLLQRALAIREAVFGRSHPEVTQPLKSLAQVRLTQQRLAEALPLLARALTVSEMHLRQQVFGHSEARLASVLSLLRSDEESLYALVRAYPGDASVRRLALSVALLRKGRSVGEIADTFRIIDRSLNPADHSTFERLRTLRTQFASLSLAGPGSLAPADYQQRLQDLASQGDTLEADLARRSAPLRALYALPLPDEIVDRVAAALPTDGALVELVAYHHRPLVPTPGSPLAGGPGELRYLALVLLPDGSTHAVDIGAAESIDRAAHRLHEALVERATDDHAAAQALYRLVFRPLRPLLGKAQRLFLVPDGQLALIPFAALHDGRQFLVDAFDITYLTSGKDLLPRPEGSPSANSVVVLADPDFDAAPAALPLNAEARGERSASMERVLSSLRAEGIDQPWPPLPGSRQEAEAIQRIFPRAHLLLGSAATKEALLKLPTPGVLHIATHGFFLEDEPAAAGSRAVGHFGVLGDTGPRQRPPEPLLRSGLVLAGARAPSDSKGSRRREDALVTALELAGMNLWGTQLVVLSACDTGRGDVQLGQGVQGLRRALVSAGAETLVTSLWKVDDAVTRQLMERYYHHLLAGQGRTTALRSAMRELRQTQPHPHFWAPFIGMGRNAPLLGL
jgi:CHAT domain-containing protein